MAGRRKRYGSAPAIQLLRDHVSSSGECLWNTGEYVARAVGSESNLHSDEPQHHKKGLRVRRSDKSCAVVKRIPLNNNALHRSGSFSCRIVSKKRRASCCWKRLLMLVVRLIRSADRRREWESFSSWQSVVYFCLHFLASFSLLNSITETCSMNGIRLAQTSERSLSAALSLKGNYWKGTGNDWTMEKRYCRWKRTRIQPLAKC